MSAVLSYLIEGALMLMLGVAIYFGWRLNRQMAVIREGREELQKLTVDFTSATTRAETALAELKGEVAQSLSQSREAAHKAATLCDDMEFLIKRGEKVADALEVGIRAGSKVSPRAQSAASDTAPPPSAPPPSAPAPRRPAPQTALSVAPEDRVGAAPPPAPLRQTSVEPSRGEAGNTAKKARAKSKSDLLKALQDMR